MFRPRHGTVFSSEELLAAEARLQARADTRTAPTVTAASLTRHARDLSRQQRDALARIAGSGRQVDLLVGPAGAGKTTTLRALRQAWTSEHGRHSVVWLAPSAAAAQVLADDLGVACETTAKWLHEQQRGRAAFTGGQLVLVDEASLAGTLTLDRLTGLAASQGAKVLLVGDWAQLQAVEAGGAFGLLAAARDDAPELVDVHRFTHAWEKGASLDLRHGRPTAVDAYLAHHRVQAGPAEAMLEAAYRAWRTDTDAGLASVLVADTTAAVQALNARARAERILSGRTHAGAEATLTDGARASVGDWVITRRNDRRLSTGRTGWVRNGDRWQITAVRADGSLVVRRHGRRHHARGLRGGTVMLPAAYVAEHVDLGYAVTAHRAQGLTVDTAHVLASPATSRENLYVAMTRGRDVNTAYLALDQGDDTDDIRHTTPPPTAGGDAAQADARQAMLKILATSGAELSATQSLQAEQDTWATVAQLAGEYDTLAATAQRDRWTGLLHACLPAHLVERALASDAFGPLAAELRRADAAGHHPEALLPRLVARHDLDGAHDVAAVLRHRLMLATDRSPRTRAARPRLIAGLIPEALGPMAPDLRAALDDRRALIEQRAHALAEQAVRTNAAWVQRVGPAPTDPAEHARWMRALVTIAAYRDRHAITTSTPLGEQATGQAHQDDLARAHAALRRAQQAAATDAGGMTQQHTSPGLSL